MTQQQSSKKKKTFRGRGSLNRLAIPLKAEAAACGHTLAGLQEVMVAFLWLTALSLPLPTSDPVPARWSQVGLLPKSGKQQGGCRQPRPGVCSLLASLLPVGQVGKRPMQRGSWQGRDGGGSRNAGQSWPLLLEL